MQLSRFLVNLTIGLGIASGAAHAQSAGGPWPERLYNPKAMSDDLILPMPCNGFMAFRPVDIPASDILDDRLVTLGERNPSFDFAEAPREAYVSGTFQNSDSPDTLRFYLAKYETMAIQWDAVMASDCPGVSAEAILPKSEVSWFDAISFSQRYTAWLLQNARDALPVNENEPGFLTLPTETEWEFAARGGGAVSESNFRSAVPFSPGDLTQHAWHDGSASSKGQAQRIGLLQPNPLGLFDMLGNVEEIVLEPYSLNSPGRLHGASGGFATKGGHFLTSAQHIRSSYRSERNHFIAATGHPNRARTVGFRLKITAPILGGKADYDAAREAWAQRPTFDPGAGRGQALGVDDIDQIAALIDDPSIRAAVTDFSGRFSAAVAARNEQRDRAASSNLRLGAFLADKLKDDARRLRGIEITYEGLKELAATGTDVGDRLTKFEEALTAGRRIMNETMTYYTDTVIELSQGYPNNVVTAQLGTEKVDLNATGQQALIPFLDIFYDHVAEYRKTKLVDKTRWMELIISYD